MEKHFTRLYFAVIVLCTILSIYIALTDQNKVYHPSGQDAVTDLTDEILACIEGSDAVYEFTPSFDDIVGTVLVFNLTHTEADVFLDDTVIYSVHRSDSHMTHTTGYSWNYVVMHPEYAGHRIRLKLHSCYPSRSVKCISYFGQYHSIIKAILLANLPKFVISIAIILLGLILLVYAVFIIGSSDVRQTLFHFSIFALLLGFWIFSDSEITTLFIPWNVAHVFFTHISLMLAPVPFLLFIRSIFSVSRHPLWTFYCYFNLFVIFVRMSLQLLGISDLSETMWITEISIGIFAVICVYSIITFLSQNKLTLRLKLNLICIVILLFTIVMDVFHYIMTHDVSVYGSFGFLLYIIIMGISTLRSSHLLLERAHENEVYRKLAYTDSLTGLFNRTAYENDLNNTENTGNQPEAVFMFDLNDLKKCNDTYGHDAGDLYIKTAAGLINEVFQDTGRCYRIGGDEFCVLLPFVSITDLDNRKALLQRLCKQQNRKGFTVPMAISAGYAVFDSTRDQTLDDTKKRADHEMYLNKQFLKKQCS